MADAQALTNLIMQLVNGSQNTALIGTDMFGNQIIQDYGQGSVVGNLLLQSRGNINNVAGQMAKESDTSALINNLTRLMLNARGVMGPVSPEVENSIRAQAANIAPALPMIANTMRSIGMDTGTIDNIIRRLYGSKGSVQHLYNAALPTLTPYVGMGGASNIVTTLVSGQYGANYNPYKLSGVSASDLADTLQFMSQSGQLRSRLFEKGSGFGLSGMGNLARNMGRFKIDEVQREEAFRDYWDDEAIMQAGARYAAEVRAYGGNMDIFSYLTEDERSAFAYDDLINEQLNNIKRDTNVSINFNKDFIDMDSAIENLNEQFADHIAKAKNRGDERAKASLEHYKKELVTMVKEMHNKKDLKDRHGNKVSVAQMLRMRTGIEAEAGARYVEEEVQDMQKELAYIEERREAALQIKDHEKRKQALEEVNLEEAAFRGRAQSTALGRAAYSVLDTTDVMSTAIGTARMAGVIRAAYAREGEQVTQAQALAATKAIAGGSLAGVDTKQLARDIDAAMTSHYRGGGKTTEFLQNAVYAQDISRQIGISNTAAMAIALDTARNREYYVKAGMSKEEADKQVQEDTRKMEMFRSMEPTQYMYLARQATKEMSESAFNQFIRSMPKDQQIAWRKIRAGNINSAGVLNRNQLFDLTGLVRPGLAQLYTKDGKFDPYVFSDFTRNKNAQAAVENDAWLQMNLENMANQEQLRNAESTLNRQMPELEFGSGEMLNTENVLFANAVEIENFLKGKPNIPENAKESERKRAVVERYYKFARQLQEQFALGDAPEVADRLAGFVGQLTNSDGSININANVAPLRAFIAGLDTARTEAFENAAAAAGRFGAGQNKALDRQADEYLAGIKENSKEYEDFLTKVTEDSFRAKSPSDQSAALQAVISQVFNTKSKPLTSFGKSQVTDALILNQSVPTTFVKNGQEYNIDAASLLIARRMLPSARNARWAAMSPEEAENIPSGFKNPVTGKEMSVLEARQLMQRVQDYTLSWAGLDKLTPENPLHPLDTVDQFNPDYYADDTYGALMEEEAQARKEAVATDAHRLLGLQQDENGKWVEGPARTTRVSDAAFSEAYTIPEVQGFLTHVARGELARLSGNVVGMEAAKDLIESKKGRALAEELLYRVTNDKHKVYVDAYRADAKKFEEVHRSLSRAKTPEEAAELQKQLQEVQESMYRNYRRAVSGLHGTYDVTATYDGHPLTRTVTAEDSLSAIRQNTAVLSRYALSGYSYSRSRYLQDLMQSSSTVDERKKAAEAEIEALKKEGAVTVEREFANPQTGVPTKAKVTEYSAKSLFNAARRKEVLQAELTGEPTIDYAIATQQEGVMQALRQAREVRDTLSDKHDRTETEDAQLKAALNFISAAEAAAERVAERNRVTDAHDMAVAQFMPLFNLSEDTDSANYNSLFRNASSDEQRFGTLYGQFLTTDKGYAGATLNENEGSIVKDYAKDLQMEGNTGHTYAHNRYTKLLDIRNSLNRLTPEQLARLGTEEITSGLLSELGIDAKPGEVNALMAQFGALTGQELKVRLGHHLETAWTIDEEHSDKANNKFSMMRRYDEIGLIGTKTAHDVYMDLKAQRDEMFKHGTDTTEIDKRIQAYESALTRYSKVYSREFKWFNTLNEATAYDEKAKKYQALIDQAKKEGKTKIRDPYTQNFISIETAENIVKTSTESAENLSKESERQYEIAQQEAADVAARRQTYLDNKEYASLNLNPQTLEEKFDAFRKNAFDSGLKQVDQDEELQGRIAAINKRAGEWSTKAVEVRELARLYREGAKTHKKGSPEYERAMAHARRFEEYELGYEKNARRLREEANALQGETTSKDYDFIRSEIIAARNNPAYYGFSDAQIIGVVEERLKKLHSEALKDLDAEIPGAEEDVDTYARRIELLRNFDTTATVAAPERDAEKAEEITKRRNAAALLAAKKKATEYVSSKENAEELLLSLNTDDLLVQPNEDNEYKFSKVTRLSENAYEFVTDIGAVYRVEKGTDGKGHVYIQHTNSDGTVRFEELAASSLMHETDTAALAAEASEPTAGGATAPETETGSGELVLDELPEIEKEPTLEIPTAAAPASVAVEDTTSAGRTTTLTGTDALLPDYTDTSGYSPTAGTYSLEAGRPAVDGDYSGSATRLLDAAGSGPVVTTTARRSDSSVAAPELMQPSASNKDADVLNIMAKDISTIRELTQKAWVKATGETA